MNLSFEPISDVAQIQALMKSVGWNERTMESWQEVLKRSSHVCSAWERDELIGFGRLVEDGRYAMIYDLAVDPNFQGKGVGKAIVKALIKKSTADSVGLFTDETEPLLKFYSSLGFKPIQGMQMRRDG